MMYAKLAESDVRLIIVLLLIFLLVFVIFGYLAILVKKIMHLQGNKMEDVVHDVVVTGVILDGKSLLKYGIKKNHRLLFVQSWIPFLIMFVGCFAIFLYCLITGNWSVNVFDMEKYGVFTLFHNFDWSNIPTTNFFGLTIICDWPKVISEPHFSVDAIGSYIFCFSMLIGGIWFLIDVQAYIARLYRLIKLSKTVFNKSLKDFDPNSVPREDIKPE